MELARNIGSCRKKRTRETGELARPVRKAAFANSARLTLEAFKKRRRLDPGDRELLKKVRDFFTSAKGAEEVFEKRLMGVGVLEKLEAYAEFCFVFDKFKITTKEKLNRDAFLERAETTLASLIADKPVPLKEVALLSSFFKIFRDVALDQLMREGPQEIVRVE